MWVFRYPISNNDTGSCTLTRLHEYRTKEEAQSAVDETKLNVYRDIYLSLSRKHICFDKSQMTYHLNFGITLLYIFGFIIFISIFFNEKKALI